MTDLQPRKESELLGSRIARYRKERGLTQAALAEKVGIARILLSDYERGKVRIYADVLAKIAIALKVSPELLLAQPVETAHEPQPSLRLIKRLQRIERLPLAQQKALLKYIDMYLKASEIDSAESD